MSANSQIAKMIVKEKAKEHRQHWIEFLMRPRHNDRKTNSWVVVPKEGAGVPSTPLGEIKFFGRWHKFAFFPAPGSVFEEVCLRDIATFCEERTHVWRMGRIR